MIAGISVHALSIASPWKMVKAIKQQADEYLHLLVYGELVKRRRWNTQNCSQIIFTSSLNAVYFTNSGAEAVEGAMKLAKRVQQAEPRSLLSTRVIMALHKVR